MVEVKEGKSNRLLKRAIIFILIPCVIASLWLFSYLKSSLPTQHGTFPVTGINANVKIQRDEYGVPSIQAKTDNDAFFAMGYVHAQDRLWQLEFQRRLAYGELSELFGYKMLDQDRWMRTLGLKYVAEKSWHSLAPHAQASLQAYSDGINAWLKQTKTLPPEFEFLEIQPRAWTAIDSLVWNKFFALNLAKNVTTEVEYFLSKQALTDQQVAELFPDYRASDAYSEVEKNSDSNNSDTLNALESVLNIHNDLKDLFQVGGKYVGSNAWVVAGKHTKNNQPILANDPHLGIQIPSLWYAVNVQGDKLHASGMSLIGLPLVIFGHNQHIAWGGTNMMADVQDLYFEQVNPMNPNQYKLDEQWLPFETRQEVIKVRAEYPASLRPALEPVTHNVRTTKTGPIVSDILAVFEQPISLSWVGLTEQDTTYQALLDANYATDWTSFQQAMSQHVAPALNFLYSDKAGNIGYLAAGRLPQRGIGEGMAILPAWQSQYRWQGEVPYAQMPKIYNPASGYLYQANNEVVTDESLFISNDWASPARANRINTLLTQKIDAGEQIDSAYMQAMQTDAVDSSVSALLPYLTALQAETAQQQAALSSLQKWQGEMSLDSVGASVFHVWMKHLRAQIIASNLSDKWGDARKRGRLYAISGQLEIDDMPRVLSKPEVWCNTDNTQSASCDKLLLSSLNMAIDELDKFFGADVDDWQWGDLQSAYYRHNPFSEIKILNMFFERTHAAAGSPNTINAASSRFDKTDGYLKTFGAGFRFVIDLDNTTFDLNYINSAGQSGHFLSDNYDDMIPKFHRGDLLSIHLPAEDQSTLTLVPSQTN
ncbi:penicillin acylase family protein [Flocculibacter collagenilyticus]|uniref:penicillin acylase family protein n=1 Tax=Flocculibacter collagenilyticus TaxID=2744479 RepID=UPI0018F7C4B9|nr:penicillin acylase family protein [Flocculibacter collagenilyticus]